MTSPIPPPAVARVDAGPLRYTLEWNPGRAGFGGIVIACGVALPGLYVVIDGRLPIFWGVLALGLAVVLAAWLPRRLARAVTGTYVEVDSVAGVINLRRAMPLDNYAATLPISSVQSVLTRLEPDSGARDIGFAMTDGRDVWSKIYWRAELANRTAEEIGRRMGLPVETRD